MGHRSSRLKNERGCSRLQRVAGDVHRWRHRWRAADEDSRRTRSCLPDRQAGHIAPRVGSRHMKGSRSCAPARGDKLGPGRLAAIVRRALRVVRVHLVAECATRFTHTPSGEDLDIWRAAPPPQPRGQSDFDLDEADDDDDIGRAVLAESRLRARILLRRVGRRPRVAASRGRTQPSCRSRCCRSRSP